MCFVNLTGMLSGVFEFHEFIKIVGVFYNANMPIFRHLLTFICIICDPMQNFDFHLFGQFEYEESSYAEEDEVNLMERRESGKVDEKTSWKNRPNVCCHFCYAFLSHTPCCCYVWRSRKTIAKQTKNENKQNRNNCSIVTLLMTQIALWWVPPKSHRIKISRRILHFVNSAYRQTN